MHDFAEIYGIAAKRKGGADMLEGLLKAPLDAAELSGLPASAWLEAMAKAIFQSGFNWSVIENKWPAFRTAFVDFDVARVAGYDDRDLDRLLTDRSIVRNAAKILAVIENARFLDALGRESGDVSQLFANWPEKDFASLLALFAERGMRLGGVTGQRVCRSLGKDSYVLTPSVCKRLIEEGVIDRTPASKRAMAAVQKAFNQWQAESGRPLTQISQVLAMSID